MSSLQNLCSFQVSDVCSCPPPPLSRSMSYYIRGSLQDKASCLERLSDCCANREGTASLPWKLPWKRTVHIHAKMIRWPSCVSTMLSCPPRCFQRYRCGVVLLCSAFKVARYGLPPICAPRALMVGIPRRYLSALIEQRNIDNFRRLRLASSRRSIAEHTP